MYKLIIITFLFALNSCFLLKENGIDFEIKNNSNLAIENVKLYTSEKLSIVEFDELKSNQGLSHRGVTLGGQGFVLSLQEMNRLKAKSPKGSLLFGYMNGRDLVNGVCNRGVIDAYGLSGDELRQEFPELFQIFDIEN